jgi:hypothetical protein
MLTKLPLGSNLRPAAPITLGITNFSPRVLNFGARDAKLNGCRIGFGLWEVSEQIHVQYVNVYISLRVCLRAQALKEDNPESIGYTTGYWI